MLCLTLRIGTIQRLCLIFHRDFRLTSTDRTNFWNIFHSASCQILRNLRNDHVRLIHADLVTDAKLKLIEDIKVVQVSAADECTVNADRIEQTGDAYHTGSGRGQLHAAEARAVEFIGPLERNQAILVMSGCSKAFAIAEVFKSSAAQMSPTSIIFSSIFP